MKKQAKILISATAIVAVVAIGTSVASTATDNATAPAKVTGLDITATTTSISMTWNAPDNGGSNITGYTVEIIANSTDTSMANATSTSFAHTAAQVGTFYEYRVRATNDVGDGPWSARGGAQIVVLEAPTAPHLTVSSTSSSIDLSWTEPHNGGSAITGYKVEYWDADSSATTSTASTSGTSWSHASATLGTTYVYRVLAINSVGEGAWSANTTGALVNPAADVPAKVTQFSVSLNSDGKRALSWTAPDDGGSAITGYTVEYDDDTKKKFTASVTGTSWVHEDSSTLGYVHSYRVHATNNAGDGPWSDTFTGLPAQITSLSTSINSDGQLVLSWTAPDNVGPAITGYTIEYDMDSQQKFTASVSGTSWVHDSAVLGYVHTYRVHATNDLGNGPWSSAVSGSLGQ